MCVEIKSIVIHKGHPVLDDPKWDWDTAQLEVSPGAPWPVTLTVWQTLPNGTGCKLMVNVVTGECEVNGSPVSVDAETGE